LALIESLSPLPVADGRVARVPVRAPQPIPFHADRAPISIVLPRAPGFRGLPFLAQYLAQEFTETAEPAPRWRERETAYRAAEADDRTGCVANEA
jgi:hypothetical protein